MCAYSHVCVIDALYSKGGANVAYFTGLSMELRPPLSFAADSQK